MFAAIFCLALAALADHANVRAHHAQTTASDAAGPAADLNAQRIRVEGENLFALELEGFARDIGDPRQEGPMAVRAEARVGHDEVGAEDWVAVPGSLTWFPTSSTLRLVLNVEESDASEVHTVSQVEIELQEDADMKHTGRQRLFWRGRVRGVPKSRATAHIHRKRKKVSSHPAMETDLHPDGSFPAPKKCALRDSNVSHIHGVISVNGVVRSYEATRVHEDNGEDRNNCEELSSGWEFRVRALEDGAREIFHRRLGESKEGNEDGYFADKESKLTDEWDDCYPGMSTMKEMKAVVMADVGYRNIFESDGEAEDEIIGTFYDSSTLIYEPQLNIRLIADHIIIGGTDDKWPLSANRLGGVGCSQSLGLRLVALKPRCKSLLKSGDYAFCHLWTDCGRPTPNGGLVQLGISTHLPNAPYGTVCTENSISAAVYRPDNRGWETLAHEAGHLLGGGAPHPQTGIMSYGDRRDNGVYRFADVDKEKMCGYLTHVMEKYPDCITSSSWLVALLLTAFFLILCGVGAYLAYRFVWLPQKRRGPGREQDTEAHRKESSIGGARDDSSAAPTAPINNDAWNNEGRRGHKKQQWGGKEVETNDCSTRTGETKAKPEGAGDTVSADAVSVKTKASSGKVKKRAKTGQFDPTNDVMPDAKSRGSSDNVSAGGPSPRNKPWSTKGKGRGKTGQFAQTNEVMPDAKPGVPKPRDESQASPRKKRQPGPVPPSAGGASPTAVKAPRRRDN